MEGEPSLAFAAAQHLAVGMEDLHRVADEGLQPGAEDGGDGVQI